MSHFGEGGLRLLAAGGLLVTALMTVLVQAQITSERYGLAECTRAREECDRRREVLRAHLPAELLLLAASRQSGESRGVDS